MTATLPRSVLDNPRLEQWISFDVPGVVTIRTGKVELGQGILTALAQIAAEELAVGIDRVSMAGTDTAFSPNEGFTAGSQSVEVSGASVRLVAAQARAALLAAAARRLGLSSEEALTCRGGAVLQAGEPTGLDLWSVAPDVDWTQPVQSDAPVAAPATYRVVGLDSARIDMDRKLGGGGFIHDIVLPGMLHARVVRQPFRLARLAEVDEAYLTRRHPGVSVIRVADFLGLVAEDEYTVARAHDAADSFVQWEDVPGRWRPATTSAAKVTQVGTPPDALPARSNSFAGDYTRGNIAHGSIGPSCGIAQMDGGGLTVWTHSQGIFALRDQIARCLGLAVAQVRVIHAHGSGCYGHNGADDAALDAAIIALRHPGRPVRVQWSRMDELSRGPLGPAMTARVEAALDDRNRVGSWSLSVRSAPHAQRPGSGGHVNLSSAEALDPVFLPDAVEDLPAVAGGGASRNSVAIYDFPSQQVRVEIDTGSRVRTSSLRSLGAHLNVFAIECAMDELAAIAGADPVAFRLAQLADPRARHVLEQAAAMSGWGEGIALAEGRGRGVALARYKGKGAWLAAVAEVSVDEDVRLDRLWLAVDAGFIVNPAGARSQIEGGAIQAASWTLKEEVRVEGDRVPAFDWSGYPILRFSEVPEIETRFVGDPLDPPLGCGEAAQGPVAAAVANAVSQALGLRLRQLPLTRDRIARAITEG
jgi:CO/xanthine dehydrogenase Mo-binding subunit